MENNGGNPNDDFPSRERITILDTSLEGENKSMTVPLPPLVIRPEQGVMIHLTDDEEEDEDEDDDNLGSFIITDSSTEEEDSDLDELMAYAHPDEENQLGETTIEEMAHAQGLVAETVNPTSPQGLLVAGSSTTVVMNMEDENFKFSKPELGECSYSKQDDEVVHEPNLDDELTISFICPICMDKMMHETSTLCGHIFCASCLLEAIIDQGKCPICRRNVKMEDIHRIYLPKAKYD